MNEPRPSPAVDRTRRASAGFTLFELMFAIVIFVVSGGAIMQGVVLSKAADASAAREAVAVEAAREMADRVAATPIDEVWARWGTGGTDGPLFTVPTLDGDGPAGRVRVLIDETKTDAQLSTSLGFPRDLDGDGAATTADVSRTAKFLPVLVEVTWGMNGANPAVYRLPVMVVR